VYPDAALDVTLAGMVAQSSVGVLFLLGAALFHRLQARGGPISFAYLTIGLAIAAFSQLHFVAIPGAYSSLVTTGDILRLAFYVVILLGVDADARVGLRDLRVAHRDLERRPVRSAQRNQHHRHTELHRLPVLRRLRPASDRTVGLRRRAQRAHQRKMA